MILSCADMISFQETVLSFFLLHMFYPAQINSYTQTDQSCYRFNLAPTNLNKRLGDHFMTSVITSSLNECLDMCMYRTSCWSINYEHRSKTCEFLQVNGTDSDSAIKTVKGYIHLDLTEWVQIRQNDPCSNKPCKKDQQCFPKWSVRSYECRDTDFFCDSVFLVSGPHGIPDNQITSSSFWHNNYALYGPQNARLNASSCWHPHYMIDAFIQAEFNRTERVVGIATQGGRHDKDEWSEAYQVSYSINCTGFVYITQQNGENKLFEGNSDRTTIKTNYFDEEIKARCVRLHPKVYHNHIAMRFDVVGCCGRPTCVDD